MSNALKDKNILVIEDEYFIAADLKRALSEQGAHVLGPAGTLELGLSLVQERGIDGALLDVNLKGETSEAVVKELKSRTIPYLVVTGYDDWALSPEYSGAVRLSKPFQMRALLDAVEVLMAEGRQS